MGIFDIFRFKAVKEEAEGQVRKAREIMRKVVNVQLTRFGQEIDNWKTGIDAWEDPNNPQTVELIRVYNDLALDPHLTAAMETRKARTLSKDYKVCDENGEELEEESDVFNSVWFREYLKMALDSRFYGYSVIQFGDRVGKGFDYVKLVPREYVYPQKLAVRESPYSNESIIPLKSGKFAPWVQFVGKRGDELGLLAKAAPMMIYKKTTQGAWAEFGELFGAPFRLGKTDVRNDELRENMYYMLENMGRNAYGVFNHDDELEFIGDKKTDAYEVYDKLIERANSEISKLILGSTMVMDDGSSRSQAEVHERTLEAIDKDDSLFIQEVVNNELIPWLNKYHGFSIKGYWKWDDAEKLSKSEQFNRDLELIKTGKYQVPAQYITETYGIPLDEIEEEDDNDDDPKGPKGPKGPKKGPKKGGPGDLDNSLDSKKKALSLDNEAFCNTCGGIEDLTNEAPIEWDELTITDVINGVYSGKYTYDNLPKSVYFRVAKELTKSVDDGLKAVGDAADITDKNFIRSLKNNAYVFSGAKTFQQVREMSDFLADNQGRRVPFGEYETKAREIFDTYNRNWLRTEIIQAENSAQMASKWQDIEADKDFLPFLTYDTIGDERVREDHKPLDGVTRPVNDPFWDTYYPPNGWRCRCEVLQEDEDAKPTKLGAVELPEVPPSMQINVGKQKVLFGPQHPYFIVDDQFKELAENNFNLEIPKEAQILGAEEVKPGIYNLANLYQTKKLADPQTVREFMDNQDGAAEIANARGTNIGFRSSKEVTDYEAYQWQKKTGANNDAPLGKGVMGHCSLRNSYVNILKNEGDAFEFGAIKLDYTGKGLKALDDLVTTEVRPDGRYLFYKKDQTYAFASAESAESIVKFNLSEGLEAMINNNNVAATFTHEINHLIHNSVDQAIIENKIRIRPKLNELMKKRGLTLKDSITYYGEVSDSEFFAEQMTVYIHSHEYMKKYHKKVFDFMEELLDLYGIDKKTFRTAG